MTADERRNWTLWLAKDNPASESEPRKPLPRVIGTREACKVTGYTPQSLRRLARNGTLERVYCKGGQRAHGFTETSIRAFLEGRNAKQKAEG